MTSENLSLRYIAVTGATGSGKSSLAREIAQNLDSEIVGCDSVQVYRGFDIGSAKEPLEGRESIPHHLIDIADWSDDYDAAKYAVASRRTIQEINSRGKIAVVAGGTGLYLRALQGKNFHDLPTDESVRAEVEKFTNEELIEKIKEKDPIRASQLHVNDRVRLVRALELITILGKPISEVTAVEVIENPPLIQIYLNPERAELHRRIEQRSELMLKQGLVNEVEGLISAGCPKDKKPMQSIGYLQVVKMLDGELPEQELQDRIIFATRQYAKRQCTWFGKQNSDIVLNASEISAELNKKIAEIL